MSRFPFVFDLVCPHVIQPDTSETCEAWLVFVHSEGNAGGSPLDYGFYEERLANCQRHVACHNEGCKVLASARNRSNTCSKSLLGIKVPNFFSTGQSTNPYFLIVSPHLLLGSRSIFTMPTAGPGQVRSSCRPSEGRMP